LRLLDLSIMTREEVDQLNRYHRQVWTNLCPLIQNDQLALKWLEAQCQPINL
jgi:Xaa-Pro aminopeptidase